MQVIRKNIVVSVEVEIRLNKNEMESLLRLLEYVNQHARGLSDEMHTLRDSLKEMLK